MTAGEIDPWDLPGGGWGEAADGDAAAPANAAHPGPGMDGTADERTVISAVLSGMAPWDEARRLRASDFASAQLRATWLAMSKASLAGTTPTRPTLLAIDPGLDQATLASLSAQAASRPAATAAAGRMLQRRRMTAAAERMRRAATALEDRLGNRGTAPTRTWQTELGMAVADLAELAGSDDTVEGDELEAQVLRHIAGRSPPVSTGIARLDEFLGGGLRPPMLLAMGGQTKVGKTVMLATISHNLDTATPPVPHLVITLERSAEEIARLKLARRLGVRADALDRLDDDAMRRLRDLPRATATCRVMHRPGATLEDIEAEATYQVRARGARVVLVDYLQLVGGQAPREGDEQHMNRAAQAFQAMPSRLWVPFVVGVQVDEFGQAWRRASAIKQSAHAYVVINRDREQTGAYLETKSSNLGDESDVGTITKPSMTLDPAGPHFR